MMRWWSRFSNRHFGPGRNEGFLSGEMKMWGKKKVGYRQRRNRPHRKKVEKRGGIRGVLKGVAALVCLLTLGVLADRLIAEVNNAPFFRILEVQITGESTLQPEEIKSLADISMGTNILKLDLREVMNRIQKHPWIADVTVRRELPHTIRITVAERVPAVYIHDKNRFFVVDREGILMGEARTYQWHLPVVYGVDLTGVPLGKGPTPASIRTALEVGRELVSDPELEQTPYLGIEITPGQEVVLHLKGAQVRLGRGGYREKMKRFSEIAKAVEEQGIPLKEVDLRYSDQVVVRTL